METTPIQTVKTPVRMPWWVRLVAVLFVVMATGIVLVTHHWLTARFVEVTRNRSELRLALYSGNMVSELQRTSVVPLLLSHDPDLISALGQGEYSRTSARLISLQNEIAVASIMLLDADGRVVGATDRSKLGKNLRSSPQYMEAQRTFDTVFTAQAQQGIGYDFMYSRAIRDDSKLLGVIVVAVDLQKYERAWQGFQDVVLVANGEGTVLLASNPRWRGQMLDQTLSEADHPSVFRRALRGATDWAQNPPDAYVAGEAVMKTEGRVSFRGWRMVMLTAYDSVRERVQGILALEIMGFAIILALGFYFVSRRALSKSLSLQRESAELRLLNARLQREISERQKAQKELEAAELTLVQSSKLAALGEMSAAVSHELNQPLAAMKTYLAGARLLLQRKRPDEALSSFQRIDDLIDRMGSITRQLKSYARKGEEAFEPVDLRDCLSSALSMMEPQLKSRHVLITRHIPRERVMIMADRIRLEQVIINLLRNALDATKDTSTPEIELMIMAGHQAILTVRDNGTGIAEIDHIFEPFYTTKKSSEGVGLGLAISLGFVGDLGGRLTARNLDGGGAVFEVQLPLLNAAAKAAQ